MEENKTTAAYPDIRVVYDSTAYKKPVALITGVTGQDGSYLAELLLKKGYEVHGMYRISSTENTQRIKHLISFPDFYLDFGDLNDANSINSLISKLQPNEVYNLASLSHVGHSFKYPLQQLEVTAGGVVRVLEAIRNYCPTARFYQASTSELFGNSDKLPQTEDTPFAPQSPYAISKLYGYWITRMYREAYGIFACNGILFNHESPRRGEDFVTKKIVREMVAIWKRESGVLELGNLDARRDWGYAKDYVEGMWLMLQYHQAGDYVLATGETHTVREFVEEVAKNLTIQIEWRGEGITEVGTDKKTGMTLVVVNPDFYRPAEVNLLCGDAGKATRELGWQPTTTFSELVKIMVEMEGGKYEGN